MDRVDEEYFEEKIKPLLDHPLIEFIGEIGDDQKEEFLLAMHWLYYFLSTGQNLLAW